VPLDIIVTKGVEKRDKDAWFDLTGRHRDGLQVQRVTVTRDAGDGILCLNSAFLGS
jgi:hypothetical protein